MSPRTRTAGLLLVALAGLAAKIEAEPAAIPLHVRGDADREVRGILTGKALDGRGAPVQAQFICSAQTPCTARVDLPSAPSGWVFSVQAEGFWPTPATVSSGESIDLWSAGTVAGEVRGPAGSEPISEITVRFSPSPGSRAPAGFPEDGVVTCPVHERTFSCGIPAGTLDLRLRARGHVSVYRWAQRVARGTVLRLGSLELKRGASLVGRVVSNERGAPKPGSCIVRLEPPGPVDAREKGRAEHPQAGVDVRGFFHLEVVPPGSWILLAEQEGFATARRAVKVLEGMEANLKEPLVLSRPARLELTLLPSQDPDGKPWMIELLEAGDAGRAETIATAPASLAGFWAKDGISSGRRLMIRARTSAGNAWFADASSFEVAGPVHRRTLDVGSEEVAGTVELGNQPLAATLTFGSPEENISVPIRSAPDGRLSGLLPRLGKWRVVITNDSPSVHREIDVDVRRGSEGKGRVEIVLPDRALVGEIVNEKGDFLERAILTISARGSSRRETAQERIEGGSFRLTGYEPGSYMVRAVGGGRVSETVPVEIADDGSSPFLRIVALPRTVVDLRLVTEAGSPVPGARVNLLRSTVFPGLSTMSGRTDGTGRVSFPTHPSVSTQCFVLAERGLPVRLFAVPTGLDEQEIVIPMAAGTIEIEKSTPRDGETDLLWQGTCFLPIPLLRGLTTSDGVRFQGIAPGEYSLCRHALGSPSAPAACSPGYLAPFGTLTLKARPGN